MTSQSLQTNEKNVKGVVYEIEDEVNIDRYKPPFVDADDTFNATNPFGVCVYIYIRRHIWGVNIAGDGAFAAGQVPAALPG